MSNENNGCPMSGHEHSGSFLSELTSHLPYAIFSVSFCLTILCFLGYFSFNYPVDPDTLKRSSGILFHGFHFMHILFSVTGTLITFYRFSDNLIKGIFVGIFASFVFCPLSDAVMPYLAGNLLGVEMKFHLCLLHELHNVLPFVIVGLINGVIIGKLNKSNLTFYSLVAHFLHILISSFASMFYLVAHGMANWYSQIGLVFLFLVIAVVIPCILSDIVTPMAFAKVDRKNERNKIKEHKENI